MPTLIMTKLAGSLDPSIKGKTMTFLQKLTADDTVPGLHIEPIKGSADPRVRTGRVDLNRRAVLFRVDANGERHYVFHGVWPHDDAIAVAEKTTLKVNPVNGLPQFEEVDAAPIAPSPAEVTPSTSAAKPALFAEWGYSMSDLTDRLGLPDALAAAAMGCTSEDEVVTLAARHEGWQGLALIELASGSSLDAIEQTLGMTTPESTGSDSDLLDSLASAAAASQFAFIEGQDELRRVIEGGNFAAWRVFLHPTQRRYVDRDYSGAFRLSGGAGTGKTVVLVHRAVRLARANPERRVLLTTYTLNLAHALRDQVALLDPSLSRSITVGAAGICVSGVDAIASAVIARAGVGIDAAVTAVLGDARTSVQQRAPSDRWRTILEMAGPGAPANIANDTFLATEYALVVLPNRITDLAGYLKVRRPGRGVALDRSRRTQVWKLIEAYRAQSRVDGTIDFAEAAAIAAAHLDANPAERPADHVLVDEGQDLNPPQLQLIRSLVAQAPNDLFLAEDSHQRIYGPRVVLSRFGIAVVGRSQRLSLNYRTTAQNLHYALSVLEGAEYVDIEGEPEESKYRSARTGPAPDFKQAAGLSDELDRVAQQVQGWLDAGTDAGSIAVLVPDQYQRGRVTTRLSEAQIPAQAVDNGSPPDDRVAVMTMHRAKGMEYSNVLVTDVGYISPNELTRLEAMDPSERADAELRRRSLVYVAATRARDQLAVVSRSN